ncbi:MAG TPA: helix-turn-helix domain-containing protein, partial [Herpetosiphonaceae bacterium]|nr:helix-turn-helix domain-containing protein [Herpetosiphonaceae bacterium]
MEPVFFGQWLKHRRRILNLTQAELAGRISCSAITVRKIESGDLLPSRQLAEALARALGVPVPQQAAFIVFARSPARTAAAADFTAEAPPPASQAPRQRLPAPMTSAVGRERDSAVVNRLLLKPHVRLLTLTGPPGTGKTRLSLEAAAQIEPAFADGACFVALAPIREPELVAPAIASALGVKSPPGETPALALGRVLADKELLLVLDNFEQVTAAAAVVADMLRAAPRVKALVSSREALNLYGEQEFPVPPLAVPDIRRLPPVEALLTYSAVELFVQ